MTYSHILVAVAPTPESQRLVNKAVSIARPANAQISLITFAADPEMYNQFAAPMLENLRELMHEETQQFLNGLVARAGYPIATTVIASGEMSESIKSWCGKHQVDLVLCGNHNQSFFARATTAAKTVVGCCGVDVLLVSLQGNE
ncbi:universal stress protein UspC [Pluralibacter gergoviae]|uniref:universal stress protein UspC n=1 Tax=Pluralibacter gergoviae TaxID=61647 RepID=UPI00190BD788|nr:universal stress protein UspC [Pluralibacter gergoviae]MBK4117380.1 universal stress protein UspC [Pluralibacter gergoviae]